MKEERELQISPAGEECRRAAKKAMDLLMQQDRTEKNIRDRLYRAGFSENASEYAIRYVTHFGYVNDLRYAQNYISFHQTERSRKELRCKLMERGVPPEIIAEAFQEYEEEAEYEALRRQLTKRLKGQRLSDMDIPAKNKIMAYLISKGYSLAAVRAVIQEWADREMEAPLS